MSHISYWVSLFTATGNILMSKKFSVFDYLYQCSKTNIPGAVRSGISVRQISEVGKDLLPVESAKWCTFEESKARGEWMKMDSGQTFMPKAFQAMMKSQKEERRKGAEAGKVRKQWRKKQRTNRTRKVSRNYTIAAGAEGDGRVFRGRAGLIASWAYWRNC